MHTTALPPSALAVRAIGELVSFDRGIDMSQRTIALVAALSLVAPVSAQEVNAPLESIEDGVFVTTGDITTCPYRFLRPVTTTIRPGFIWDKTPDVSSAFEKLGSAGRKAGADAVILATAGTPHFALLNIRSVTVTGRAVAFVDRACSPANRPRD